MFSFQGASEFLIPKRLNEVLSFKSASVNLFEVVGQNGLEPSTSRLSVVCSSQLSYWPMWWRLRESNPWPPACKAGALPAELNPQLFKLPQNWTIPNYFANHRDWFMFFLRKEVIQPHLPIRLPCYDLTLIIDPTFDGVLLAVRLPASGVANSHGLTGGVYKARERIHRSMLTYDY